jgi:hypothetical protein
MKDTSAYDEKRSFIRMRLDAIINFSVDGQSQTYEGKCKNISGTGVLIETNTSFEPGTQLNIVIPSESTEIDDLNAVAEVLRVKSLGAHKFELATEMKEIKP